MRVPSEAPRQLAPDATEVPDVLALIRRAFAFMEARINPPSSMHRLSEASMRQQCSTGEVWVIGDPIKACIFLSDAPDALYLGKLAVADAHRGAGLARQLVDLAEGRARDRGFAALVLELRVELVENHAAFGAMGFVKTREGAHDGFDHPTYIEMRKTL